MVFEFLCHAVKLDGNHSCF